MGNGFNWTETLMCYKGKITLVTVLKFVENGITSNALKENSPMFVKVHGNHVKYMKYKKN